MRKQYFYLFVLFFIISCAKPRIETGDFAEQNNSSDLPDQIAWNVETLFIDSNYTKAKLYAARARVYNRLQQTILDGGVKVIFLSKTNGARISQLTCDSLLVDDNSKNMYAYRNVKIISDSSNSTLETCEMYWNEARQKAISEKYVKIVTPTETIEGYGFESDQNLKNYKILKVSGVKK